MISVHYFLPIRSGTEVVYEIETIFSLCNLFQFSWSVTQFDNPKYLCTKAENALSIEKQ